MRLNTFIFTLCVCALHVRAASISPEKRLDDLDNVDLDNVAVEPELIDQVTVKDIDNHLRKTIVDIPVKIVEEQKVVDENSNDYIPSNEDNIVIKRVEIDLNNPGPPQRQEHETQNPENYGDIEKALFGIKSSIDNTKDTFTTGLQGVTNSLNTLLENNVDIPAIQQNINYLRQTFSEQFLKLNETIRNNFLRISPEKNEQSEKSLEVIESRLENIQKNFKNGIDTLNEGVEVLTILKEEDDIAKANPKSIAGEDEAVKADTPENKPQPDNTGSTGTTGTPVSIPQNPIQQFVTNFQNTMSSTMNSLTSAIQNAFGGGNAQNQPQGQQSQGSQPAGAQSDTAVPTATQAPGSWSPQGFFQQVQNTWQSLTSGGQNNQQATQQVQQTTPPANNGPFAQVLQNIGSFLQNPGQAFQQQPPAPVSNPSPTPEKAPEKPSATNSQPENVIQADAIPLVTQPVQQAQQAVPVQQPAPQIPIQQPQPVQSGPIQQLVQNNPIIKGIQTAVNRIQSPPKPETPRNDIIKSGDEEESGNSKGHHDNQGNSDIVGVETTEEKKEENLITAKGEEEIVEEAIKAEETKVPSLSEKTEEVVV